MRVISGTKRGKKLETLKGDSVRPTTDKVKESIFNAIQFDLPDCSFLDLFAGSGQMGIEALSRGASHATFIDKNRSSIDIIKKNLASTQFFNDATVLKMDSILFLKNQKEKFDIVFLDPPYKVGLLQEALSLITNVINVNGKIICEHPIDEKISNHTKQLDLIKEYKYGKIMISIYKYKDVEDDEFSNISRKF